MLFSFSKCKSNETLIESNPKQHDLKLTPPLKENDWKQKIVVGRQGTSRSCRREKSRRFFAWFSRRKKRLDKMKRAALPNKRAIV